MAEIPKNPLDNSGTTVTRTESGMNGADLTPVIAALGSDAVRSASYRNPVVFNYKGKTKHGQAMHQTESGTFLVWPPIPPTQPGQVTGQLGVIPPLKPYRVQAKDIRPMDPRIDQ